MNIVEFFVRANLRRKIASRDESIHDINERLAEIGSQLETWTPMKTHTDGQPDWLVDKIGNLRAERAKLSVRKTKFEKELRLLEITLTEEYRKQRSV
jgi:hypothetical protein